MAFSFNLVLRLGSGESDGDIRLTFLKQIFLYL